MNGLNQSKLGWSVEQVVDLGMVRTEILQVEDVSEEVKKQSWYPGQGSNLRP